MYGERVKDYVDGTWANGEREEFWIKPMCVDLTCPVATAWAHGYGFADGIRFETPEAAAANWNKRAAGAEDPFVSKFGMTPHAAARVMSNFQGLVRKVIDENVFASSSGDDSWVEYLQDHDIEVTDERLWPSCYFEIPDGATLFRELISAGTYHGGMSDAIAATREIGVRL